MILLISGASSFPRGCESEILWLDSLGRCYSYSSVRSGSPQHSLNANSTHRVSTGASPSFGLVNSSRLAGRLAFQARPPPKVQYSYELEYRDRIRTVPECYRRARPVPAPLTGRESCGLSLPGLAHRVLDIHSTRSKKGTKEKGRTNPHQNPIPTSRSRATVHRYAVLVTIRVVASKLESLQQPDLFFLAWINHGPAQSEATPYND